MTNRHLRPRRFAVRASAGAPRVELMPLLDVVFLLLTFFIYAMAVMVRADALDVGLASVAGAGGPSDTVEHVLRVETDGTVTYNDQPLDADDLPALLDTLAADASQPTLYVALAQDAAGPGGTATTPLADRGPVLWSLLQQVEAAQLSRVAIVGPPAGP